MKLLPIILIVGAIASGLVFIFQSNENTDNIIYDPNEPSIVSSYITIGTIHRDAAKMTDRFQPMADHIAKQLSNDNIQYIGKVGIPNTQEKMIESINTNQVDLYFDSTLIGMKLNKDAKMSPSLFAWKEGVISYHTVFIAPKTSDINSLDAIHGKTMVFEDPESSSGYLLPKYHLEQMGYVLSNDVSGDITYKFSLDDENTPIWVLEGKGDLGALSNLDFDDIPTNAKANLKIIGKTQDIPRQIVFFKNDLDNADQIVQILLEMEQKADPAILDSAKISKFSKLDPKDLRQIRNIIDSM